MLEIFSYVNNLYCLLIIFRMEDFHMSTTFGVSLENKTRLVEEKENWKRKNWIEKFCFPGGTTELPLPCIENFLIQINFNGITENRWCTSFYFVGFDYVREM